jgi:hypothetical protein
MDVAMKPSKTPIPGKDILEINFKSLAGDFPLDTISKPYIEPIQPNPLS